MNETDNKRLLTRYELSIVRAFAGAVKSAYEQYEFDICDYFTKMFSSEVFDDFEEEHCIYTQGSHCIAGKILESIPEDLLPIKKNKPNIGDAPVAYWMGYVIMAWKILEHRRGKYFKRFNMIDLYWEYESLHCMSVERAINVIKRECLNDVV